jgi:8-oxo-dGTP pyrophosphatase MutT (NUDIX family)
VIRSRNALIEALRKYKTDYEAERPFIPAFLSLLAHPNAFLRTHLPGHITGSAWIIDESASNVLLTHHAKLNRWLQPGGHADGDEDIMAVAVREAMEETGLTALNPVIEDLFDIDIHTIPARKDFPEHLHYDVRILLEASRDQNIIMTEESHDLKWVSLNEIEKISAGNTSMLRMADKVRALF